MPQRDSSTHFLNDDDWEYLYSRHLDRLLPDLEVLELIEQEGPPLQLPRHAFDPNYDSYTPND